MTATARAPAALRLTLTRLAVPAVAIALAAPALAQTTAIGAADIALKLPRDLSPWGMFLAADAVVKAVMIGLCLASLLTWTIWLAKTLELFAARRGLHADAAAIENAASLAECLAAFGDRNSAAADLARAANAEIRASADTGNPDGLKQRVASRLERLEAAAGRRMIRGTGLLATVGATAPFVGLFGTVWGIMNSFIGISKQQTTNLAVVAPGIAEALLATALGLVAAIPAVVMYNFLSRRVAGYRVQHGDAAAAVMRLVSRDLDRGLPSQQRVRAAAE